LSLWQLDVIIDTGTILLVTSNAKFYIHFSKNRGKKSTLSIQQSEEIADLCKKWVLALQALFSFYFLFAF